MIVLDKDVLDHREYEGDVQNYLYRVQKPYKCKVIELKTGKAFFPMALYSWILNHIYNAHIWGISPDEYIRR